MANQFGRITARAKVIRKAHPHLKWTDAIKKASKELKGKLSKADLRLPHGYQVVKRKKRRSKKKATTKSFLSPSKKRHHKRRVAGVGSLRQAQGHVPTRLAREVAEKYKCEEQIAHLQRKLRETPAASDKAQIRKSIVYYRKCAKAAKSNISNLKKLL